MSIEITVNNALEQAMIESALKEKREWEQKHNQQEAVTAIDNLLEQL